ncbi:MAG: hypothetical protein Q9196_005115 [Gyalolechia fulgens]
MNRSSPIVPAPERVSVDRPTTWLSPLSVTPEESPALLHEPAGLYRRSRSSTPTQIVDALGSFVVVKRPDGQTLTNADQEIRLSDAIASAYHPIDEKDGSPPFTTEQNADQSASASSFPPPYGTGPSPSSYAAENSPLGWWEEGAEKVLRGSDLEAIQLVCRFRTYRDESLPGEILRTRWSPLLDAFFVCLHAGDWETVAKLDKDQKVEGILKQLSPSFPSPDPLEIQLLHDLLPIADTSLVALQLNKISCSALKRINFSGWARAARDPGDYVEPVENFFVAKCRILHM